MMQDRESGRLPSKEDLQGAWPEPTEEQLKASFERFVWKPSDLIWPSCVSCLRKLPGTVCEAYPEGIPEAILSVKVDHKTPYPGDGGLTYLPRTPQAVSAAGSTPSPAALACRGQRR